MNKRESCRAIIFVDDSLVLMHRIKPEREYYTFIGGGKNENETIFDCMIREVFEELGINVEPEREIYTYENEKTFQHFIICKWISGEFGTGKGEEFDKVNQENDNLYMPVMCKIEDVKLLPLMPEIVKTQLLNDIQKFGFSLSNEIICLKEN